MAVGIDADLFTMKVNHGGAIVVVDGVATYKDGEIEYFDFYKGDFMSMLELNDFAERLRYDQKGEFFYNVQGNGTLSSFEKLDNDMDVFGMVSDGLRYREVEKLGNGLHICC